MMSLLNISNVPIEPQTVILPCSKVRPLFKTLNKYFAHLNGLALTQTATQQSANESIDITEKASPDKAKNESLNKSYSINSKVLDMFDRNPTTELMSSPLFEYPISIHNTHTLLSNQTSRTLILNDNTINDDQTALLHNKI